MKTPLVYIAGPYTNPDPVMNTHTAVHTGLDVYDRYGVGVLIPHLTLLAHAIRPNEDVEYWYQFDLKQVESCDAVIRFPGKSSGADKEVEFARERRIPVFFWPEEEENFVRWLKRREAWG